MDAQIRHYCIGLLQREPNTRLEVFVTDFTIGLYYTDGVYIFVNESELILTSMNYQNNDGEYKAYVSREFRLPIDLIDPLKLEHAKKSAVIHFIMEG